MVKRHGVEYEGVDDVGEKGRYHWRGPPQVAAFADFLKHGDVQQLPDQVGGAAGEADAPVGQPGADQDGRRKCNGDNDARIVPVRQPYREVGGQDDQREYKHSPGEVVAADCGGELHGIVCQGDYADVKQREAAY